jgi:hypothetical protein
MSMPNATRERTIEALYDATGNRPTGSARYRK